MVITNMRNARIPIHTAHTCDVVVENQPWSLDAGAHTHTPSCRPPQAMRARAPVAIRWPRARRRTPRAPCMQMHPRLLDLASTSCIALSSASSAS